jgi:hypothetical protein
MTLEEEDEFIQHVLANRDATMAAAARSMTNTATSEGTLVEQEVDESDFVRSVRGTPLDLSSFRFLLSLSLSLSSPCLLIILFSLSTYLLVISIDCDHYGHSHVM